MRKGPCWYDSQNHPHSTLPECQVEELHYLGFGEPSATQMVEKAAQVINILNVTAKSRLAGRKLNGAKRKKRFEAPQEPLPIDQKPPF